jgi:AcrR family transcriptional regulator
MDKKIFRPSFATATDARVVQTREALRGALLELLKIKSLEQITIREITALAGIGYTTFFRHHPTKETLLEDIAAEEIERLIELSLRVFDDENVQAASLALCNYVDENKTLWSTLLTGGAAGALRAEFIRVALEVASSRPANYDWLPAEVGSMLVASGTVELLAWWLKQPEPISVQQLATIFERVVVAPITTPSERYR